MKLPGDLPREHEIARMIRVDHAGEYGAARIYAGQLAVLSGTPQEGVCVTWPIRNSTTLNGFRSF